MKALVAVKRVMDVSVKVRVNKEQTAVDLEGSMLSTNPFCQIAIEEAVRQKQKKKINQITALLIGPKKHSQTLMNALALGCDRAIHIINDLPANQHLPPIIISRILQKIVQKNKYDLVFLGKQSIDDDCNQTGQMLAGRLGWGQGCFASSVQIEGQKVKVCKEVDAGLQYISLSLPAVITCDLRLNNPRIANIMNLKRAKSKPFEQIKLQSLQVCMQTGITMDKVESPRNREGSCTIVESVDELISKLKNQAKIL